MSTVNGNSRTSRSAFNTDLYRLIDHLNSSCFVLIKVRSNMTSEKGSKPVDDLIVDTQPKNQFEVDATAQCDCGFTAKRESEVG